VGAELEPAGILSAEDVDGQAGHRRLARLATTPLVFSGPGSPTYALRHWRDTLVPSLLAEKLALGGAVTFASAAALTLGEWTVPVYEIYKAGEDPHWAPGLDLLGPLGLGLRVAVIAHYDNAEGGTHDTRYCYLGERRLKVMEDVLPEGAFVLGVDEHTALSLDLDAGTASVVGLGAVTVRARGSSYRIEAGSDPMPASMLAELADELSHQYGKARVRSGPTDSPSPAVRIDADRTGPEAGSPLLQEVRRLEESFRNAQRSNDPAAMVAAALGVHDELWAWRADTFESDEVDRGRAALGAMLAELGELAELGARHPAEVVGPFVDLVVEFRQAARRDRRFEEADALRDRLGALGVAVHDSQDASTWEIESAS
jgi:hypothetical protein